MTVGERVAQARRALGREWTQQRLTDELKKAGLTVSRGWIANLETGRVRNLSSEETGTLARVLKKPSSFFEEPHSRISELIAAIPPALRIDPSDSGYRFLEIPHLGTVSASRFTFSFDVPPENFTTMGIKGGRGDRYAMLTISGDCMEPRIEDGDEVLIRQTSDVPDGTIAIVSFDAECTMKRVYRKKDGVELRADNAAYKPVRYPSNKVRILAEVVKIIKDPRRKP